MLGKGPYTTTHCPPSHELAQKLADTLDELREAAREGDWTINWRPLDQSCQAAVAADQAGKFSEAIRHYCRGISYVMKELRSPPIKTCRRLGRATLGQLARRASLGTLEFRFA